MSNKKNIKTKLICIDGADNTGKSTLIEYMKQQEEFKNSNTLFLSFPTDEFRNNYDNDKCYERYRSIIDPRNLVLSFLNDIVSNLFTEIFKNEYDYIVCDRSYLSTYIYNYIYPLSDIGNNYIEIRDSIMVNQYNKFTKLLFSVITKSLSNKILNKYNKLDIYQIVLLSNDINNLILYNNKHGSENDNKIEKFYDNNIGFQYAINKYFTMYCEYFEEKYNNTFKIKNRNILVNLLFKISNICVYIDIAPNMTNLPCVIEYSDYKRKSVEEIYDDIVNSIFGGIDHVFEK